MIRLYALLGSHCVQPGLLVVRWASRDGIEYIPFGRVKNGCTAFPSGLCRLITAAMNECRAFVCVNRLTSSQPRRYTYSTLEDAFYSIRQHASRLPWLESCGPVRSRKLSLHAKGRGRWSLSLVAESFRRLQGRQDELQANNHHNGGALHHRVAAKATGRRARQHIRHASLQLPRPEEKKEA